MSVTKPLSQLEPGQRLGAYTVERLIGRGRHSEVYRAVTAGSDRAVALKVFLASSIPSGSDRAARFLGEVAALAKLSHPNIARIVDYGADPARGLCYLVQEYFEGATLRDDITAHPNGYPRDELWRLFEPVADALAYAHERGHVHGNIRPDHIFLTPNRRPMLTDFSLASLAGDEETGRAAPLGAVAYWAPEKAAQIQPTVATDIYALGVLLYELAVGDVPFKARTRDALVAQHLYETPVPPGQRRAGLDPRIERAILVALSKNPAQRFNSVRDMLAMMSATSDDDYATLKMDKRFAREVRRHSGANAIRVPRPEPPVPEPLPATQPSAPAQHQWAWIALGIVIAAALLALALI